VERFHTRIVVDAEVEVFVSLFVHPEHSRSQLLQTMCWKPVFQWPVYQLWNGVKELLSLYASHNHQWQHPQTGFLFFCLYILEEERWTQTWPPDQRKFTTFSELCYVANYWPSYLITQHWKCQILSLETTLDS